MSEFYNFRKGNWANLQEYPCISSKDIAVRFSSNPNDIP